MDGHDAMAGGGDALAALTSLIVGGVRRKQSIPHEFRCFPFRPPECNDVLPRLTCNDDNACGAATWQSVKQLSQMASRMYRGQLRQ